jgi:D-arabinose 1-dehydrogenase-like Zn-dependent alcohol dehydrogenase
MNSSEVSQTGRLAYMTAPNEVEIREYPVPSPAPGAAVLETLLAGVCGSEIHMFHGHHPLQKSIVLGHEIVGRVVALGEGLDHDGAGDPLAVGDVVSATYFQFCGECESCTRGELNWCERALEGWVRHPDEAPHFVGTMGTHYYVEPHQWIFKLPENVTPRMAAAANCALAQVVNAVEAADVRPGQRVVVQGAGGLGLYTVGLLKERGATVVSIDGVDLRLDRAKAFGADHVVDFKEYDTVESRQQRIAELIGEGGADAVMDMTGNTAAFVEAIGLVRRGGRLIEVGMVLPGNDVTIDLGAMARGGVTVIPSHRYEPRHLHEALGFLSRNAGRLPFEEMIDAVYPLDQVAEAIEDSAARKVTRAAIAP